MHCADARQKNNVGVDTNMIQPHPQLSAVASVVSRAANDECFFAGKISLKDEIDFVVTTECCIEHQLIGGKFMIASGEAIYLAHLLG
jgi:hypothetical protein